MATGTMAMHNAICRTRAAMGRFGSHIAMAVLSAASMAVHAEPASLQEQALSAVKATFPGRDFSIWTSAVGDFNGDGIDDIALVATASRESGMHEERLVVLAGQPGGRLSVLSVSDDFCHARQFYNLSTGKRSLLVEGFSNSRGDLSSFTLQFRYNKALKDLELIGHGNFTEESEKDRSYRVSRNFLTSRIIHSRKDGKRRKETTGRLPPAPLARLQGFDCLNFNPGDGTGLYIEEDFSVKKR